MLPHVYLCRYLAPEMLSGKGEAGLDKVDMFALGITLYELASGSPLPTGGLKENTQGRRLGRKL